MVLAGVPRVFVRLEWVGEMRLFLWWIVSAPRGFVVVFGLGLNDDHLKLKRPEEKETTSHAVLHFEFLL
jgi:hypothetical protein